MIGLVSDLTRYGIGYDIKPNPKGSSYGIAAVFPNLEKYYERTM